MCTEIRKLQPKYFLSSSCMLLLSEMKCFIQFPTIFAIAVYLFFFVSLFVCFCYCFFFFIIILLSFILLFFLYFTTHIFVTLIKDYKIYLVAKRPQQACQSFPKEISHFPCFFFNRYFVSMNMLCKLFIGLHTRYLQCLSKNKIPDCFHKLSHSYLYQGIEYRAELIRHRK